MSPPITAIPGVVLIHLLSVIPAMVLGAIILWRRKGSPVHKIFGRTWIALMLTTAVISFGIRSDGHLSWIHVLCVVIIVTIAAGLLAIRRGKVKPHRRCMQGTYSGMVIAFLFTLAPGRLLGQWLRQLLA